MTNVSHHIEHPTTKLSYDRTWVFVHGFTQTHHSWWPLIDALNNLERSPESSGTRTHDADTYCPGTYCLVDLPGHGSAPPPNEPGLREVAKHLVSLGGRGTYDGYSLGGRIALTAAARQSTGGRERSTSTPIERSAPIERLVLVSATAGLDDAVERRERYVADVALAERIEAIGLDTFLDWWTALPLFGSVTPTDRRHRERNSTTGLSSSLRNHGTGSMLPLWNHLTHVEIPVLIVAGEQDTKFVEIGQRLESALRNATLTVIPHAHHSIPIEAPIELAAAIAEWDAATRRSI